MVGKWHPEGGSRANPEPSRFQIPSLCLRCTGSNLPLPLSRAFEPLVKQASPRCILFKVCVYSNHRPHSRAEHATPELVSVLVWADRVSQRRDSAGSYQEQRHLLGCSFEVLITSLPGDRGTVKSENHCSLASRPC